MDNIITTANGRPFETYKAARMQMGRRQLTDDDAAVVPMGSGYVIRLKGNPEEMSSETQTVQENEMSQAEQPVTSKPATKYFWCMFGVPTDGTDDNSDVALNPNGLGYLYFRRGEMVIAPEAYYEAGKDATCYETRTVDDGSIVQRRLYTCPVSNHGPATEAEFLQMLAERKLVSRSPFPNRKTVRNTMSEHLVSGM